MGVQWLLAAGILLAALWMVSASSLSLPSTRKDTGWPPSAPGMSALQGNSKKTLVSLNILQAIIDGVSLSAERKGETPSTRVEALSPEDSVSSTPGPSHMTRSVTFTITNEVFSAALLNPDSWKHQLLHKIIHHQVSAPPPVCRWPVRQSEAEFLQPKPNLPPPWFWNHGCPSRQR
ncbi:PREDICTED: taste receptor cell protein 1-like [Cercocebus atys]|uniref:taste receptor cell protein 1-like n=1 Tax=Cercocebus atys TaxID=9531 RepID=UPI0005F56EBC|nr:PREDICTED: taste receptor cell protein 1-like [Cercocebus atys]